MAIRPDWNIGKITLVASSADFTTASAMLNISAIELGDVIITPSGHILVIKEITGNNSGTLMLPCPAGAAGADQPLRIRFQPDGSRVAGALRTASALLSGGNVEAFAGLSGVEDGVPVFTGFGTMQIIPKSDFSPDDERGNLAELAALAKENDQLLVFGDDGKIATRPITGFTEPIASLQNDAATLQSDVATLQVDIDTVQSDVTQLSLDKYELPEGGSATHLIDATGAAIPKSGLPISDAAQTALGVKASYNWIINGDFTINQRGGVKKPANGVYGFDRWKGHTSGIEQIIEALPAGEYTLTWTGGGNGKFGGQTKASPIKATVVGGNTSVVVPQTATKVSVVVGDATAGDPWSNVQRSIGYEILLARRYFLTVKLRMWGLKGLYDLGQSVPYGAMMRTTPTAIIVSDGSNAATTNRRLEEITSTKMDILCNANNTGNIFLNITASADAEL